MDNFEIAAIALHLLHEKTGGDLTNEVSLSLLSSALVAEGIPKSAIRNTYMGLSDLNFVDFDGSTVALKVELGDWVSLPPDQQAAALATWGSSNGFGNTTAAEPSYTPPAERISPESSLDETRPNTAYAENLSEGDTDPSFNIDPADTPNEELLDTKPDVDDTGSFLNSEPNTATDEFRNTHNPDDTLDSSTASESNSSSVGDLSDTAHEEETESKSTTTYGQSSGGYGGYGGYGSSTPRSPVDGDKVDESAPPETVEVRGRVIPVVDMNAPVETLEDLLKPAQSEDNDKTTSPSTMNPERDALLKAIAPTIATRPTDMSSERPKPPIDATMPDSTHSEPKEPTEQHPTSTEISKPSGYGNPNSGNTNTSPSDYDKPQTQSSQKPPAYGNKPPTETQQPAKPTYGNPSGQQSQSPAKPGYGSGTSKTNSPQDAPSTSSNSATWGASNTPTGTPNSSERSGLVLPHLAGQTRNTSQWGQTNSHTQRDNTDSSNTHIIELALLEAYDDEQIANIADKTRRLSEDIRATQGDVVIRLELTVYHSAENAEILQSRLEDFSRRSGFNAKNNKNTLNLRFKLQL